MKILVLNSGSSSVKFQVIDTDLERMETHRDQTLAVGAVEKIGLSDSRAYRGERGDGPDPAAD